MFKLRLFQKRVLHTKFGGYVFCVYIFKIRFDVVFTVKEVILF
jgi:hypothetical protein